MEQVTNKFECFGWDFLRFSDNESQNQGKIPALISLKTQRKISKKQCVNKYCSCGEACQFSSL